MTEPRNPAKDEAHRPETLIPAGLFTDREDCPHRVSLHAREFFCRANLQAKSFKAATGLLAHLCGVNTSAERFRQVVEEEGKRVQKVQQAGSRTPEGEPAGALAPAWTAVQSHVLPADTGQMSFEFMPRRIYVSIDGVMAPRVTAAEKNKRRDTSVKKRRAMPKERRVKLKPLPPKAAGSDRPWKEVKATLHFDQHGKHSHASVTTGNHRGAGGLIDRDARKLLSRVADEKLAMADGAVWIRRRFEEAAVQPDAIILDWYHFSEHVHAARRVVFGEREPEGFGWAECLLDLARTQGPDAFLERLYEEKRVRRGTPREAIGDLLRYASERRSGINYPEFLRRGWHIGSGLMEASCKTLPSRLKGSGMRWDRRGTDAITNLAALEQNGQWEGYWKQAA